MPRFQFYQFVALVVHAVVGKALSLPPAYTCDASSSTNMAKVSLRSVKKVLPRPPSHWVGDGFKVYPVFANLAFTEEISPLLMFDYAEPRKFPAKVGPPLGVGQVSQLLHARRDSRWHLSSPLTL